MKRVCVLFYVKVSLDSSFCIAQEGPRDPEATLPFEGCEAIVGTDSDNLAVRNSYFWLHFGKLHMLLVGLGAVSTPSQYKTHGIAVL